MTKFRTSLGMAACCAWLFAHAPTAGAQAQVEQQVIFTSSQPWTVPDGVTVIRVELVGGGGGATGDGYANPTWPQAGGATTVLGATALGGKEGGWYKANCTSYCQHYDGVSLAGEGGGYAGCNIIGVQGGFGFVNATSSPFGSAGGLPFRYATEDHSGGRQGFGYGGAGMDSLTNPSGGGGGGGYCESELPVTPGQKISVQVGVGGDLGRAGGTAGTDGVALIAFVPGGNPLRRKYIRAGDPSSWAVPTGVTMVNVELIGAGGGGLGDEVGSGMNGGATVMSSPVAIALGGNGAHYTGGQPTPGVGGAFSSGCDSGVIGATGNTYAGGSDTHAEGGSPAQYGNASNVAPGAGYGWGGSGLDGAGGNWNTAGGGAGGYCKKTLTVQPGQSLSFTVGAGGSAGSWGTDGAPGLVVLQYSDNVANTGAATALALSAASQVTNTALGAKQTVDAEVSYVENRAFGAVPTCNYIVSTVFGRLPPVVGITDPCKQIPPIVEVK